MSDLSRSEVDELLTGAIAALQAAERLLSKLERKPTLDALDATAVALRELRECVELFPQVQMDLRIARMRLVAALSHDPDKTPVVGISTATMHSIRDPGRKKP